MFPKPISWLGMEKQNLTQQNHAFTTAPHQSTNVLRPFLFPGPPGSAGARIELLDFMVQGMIDRGRHAFTNQNKCTTTRNKHKKLKPGLVAS